MAETQKVNFNPGEFGEGGGLIDDVDATITDIRFIMTDYDGAITDMVPVAKILFDVDGEEQEQLFSVGGKGDFAPDETGLGLVALKSKSTLTKKSKFGMLMGSLVEAGFPLNKMDAENVSYLVGLDGHFERKPVEFKGLKKTSDKENTVLICTKINTLPWDQKKGAKGKAGAGAKKGAPVTEELADSVAGAIVDILIEKDGESSKKDMLSAAFKADFFKGHGEKKAVLTLAKDDTFLENRDEWTYEDGVLKMA